MVVCIFCQGTKKVKLRAENTPVCEKCWNSMVTRCNSAATADYRRGGRCTNNTIDPSGRCYQHLNFSSYEWRECGKQYINRFTGKISYCNSEYNITLDYCDYCRYREENP